MKDRKILPFERNRYYIGKMLTSADFQAEQKYMNDKRRFLNRMIYGSGIVCGLSVFSLDDLSVLVESGAAIDGLGREIVVENAVVQKLSAVKGFEELTTDMAGLCLRYREEEVQPVYAVYKQEGKEEYEYNHIREGYELYLTDAEKLEKTYEPDTEFLIKETLFESRDYRIRIIMPAVVCTGRRVRMSVQAEKLSEEQAEFSYRASLQMPAFTAGEEGHRLTVSFEKLTLECGDVFVKDYWLQTQEAESSADIVLENGSVEAKINDQGMDADTELNLKIRIEDCKPGDLVARETGRWNLEMRSMAETEDYIHLADLKLTRTESAYLIEEVVETNRKPYIPIPGQENIRREYLEYFEEPAGNETAVQTAPPAEEGFRRQERHRMPQIAAGTVEIFLGDMPRRKEVYFSGEIMHGLGKGEVYVTLGYDYVEEDRPPGAAVRNTVYGNYGLFADGPGKLPDVETAVKVFHDKGSFVAAVKLLGETSSLMLRFRWTALKCPAADEMKITEDTTGKSIAAMTPTVVLGTKESHFFAVRYTNMDSCSLAYELTESGSGEISPDGVYTAPARAGVYEIHIYCTDMPFIDAYAYAIVRKKGPEEKNHDL